MIRLSNSLSKKFHFLVLIILITGINKREIDDDHLLLLSKQISIKFNYPYLIS